MTATKYLGYNHIVECTIYVTDVLDPVQCTSNPLLVEIREDTAPGNMSQCMNCSLPEKPGEKIRYVTSSFIITVDASGLLQLHEELDYENQTRYNISVSFTYSNGKKVEGSSSMEVSVIPINEYSPIFNQSTYAFSLPKESVIGTLVGSVSAVDEDEGPDSVLEYKLINGNEYFHIKVDTGLIYSSAVFDHEEQNEYILIVSVTDSPLNDSTALTDKTSVIVHITDINDNSPVFDEDVYIAEVSEVAEPQIKILSVRCSDMDSEESTVLKYMYTTLDDNDTMVHFSVNESSGVVSLENKLDFRNKEISPV